MKHQFVIAGIPFVLHFTFSPPLQLSDNLLDFTSKSNANVAPTNISCVKDPIKLDNHSAPFGADAPSISMIEDGSNLLFYSYIYQIYTDRKFREVSFWSPHEEELSLQRENRITYDGFPTMLFITWGRATSHNLCFFHGALVAYKNSYFILTGDSGVGKTTLSKIFCSAGGTCLTEENVFIGADNDSIHGYATPWPGIIGNTATQKQGQLAGVFFLHHAKTNSTRRLSRKESFRKLIHTSRTFNWLPETIPSSMELIKKTADTVPCYDLGFFPDNNAIQTIEELL